MFSFTQFHVLEEQGFLVFSMRFQNPLFEKLQSATPNGYCPDPRDARATGAGHSL